MKNEFYKKTIAFVQAEKRIFLALVFLALAFFVNQALYSSWKKTVASCAGGKCVTISSEKPQLSKGDNFYYVDDLLKNKPSGFYRLTFQEKSVKNEKIILKLNTYSEKENKIGELNFGASGNFQSQEMFFFLPEGFDSLLFQKENSDEDSDIFIKEIGMTKLNVDDQKDLLTLKKTIIGKTEANSVNESQNISSDSFQELKEKKSVVGQVFRASDDRITAVSLNIDINKSLNPGSRQYVLSLKKAKYDGENVSTDGPAIADAAFSVGSIEKYRQNDGTFLFPLYAKLEKNKYYLLSLDNSKVDVDSKNYLEVKGSNDVDSYLNGSAVVKKNKDLYVFNGDLYFKIYGASFSQENGAKILNGAKIEDLGKGVGKYSYETKGKFIDLLDLENSSEGTEFSDSLKVITAPAKDSASFSYAVNTIYPVKKMNFSASQLKAGWKKVKVDYSFDGENWTSLPFSNKTENAIGSADDAENIDNQDSSDGEDSANGDSSDNSAENSGGAIAEEMVQSFDYDIIPTKEIKTIYFKVSYDPNDTSKARSFALKNLKITADLKMK